MGNQNTILENSIQKHIGIKVDDLGLSIQELRFVREVCTRGFDYAKAHEIAGFVGENYYDHRIEGRKLAAKENIAEAIKRFIDVAIGPYIETLQYEVVEKLRNMATWDVLDFFNDDGSVKQLSDIPEDKRVAIEGVNIRFYGKDAQRKVVEFKLTDRKNIMSMLLALRKELIGNKSEIPKKDQDNIRKILDSVNSKNKKQVKITERMREVLLRDIGTDDPDSDSVFSQDASTEE